VTLMVDEPHADIEVLLGDLSKTTSAEPWEPFDDRVVAFLASLSRQLMKDANARTFPDLIALAYWCRNSNLSSLASRYSDMSLTIGRGVSFHIPPSNVPLNCAYSLLSGLLAGNSCVIRLSSTSSAEVDMLLATMNNLMQLAEHATVAERIVFVRYGHDDSITSRLSSIADVRVIWGGDVTVGHIKAIAAKPRCVDVAFADRVSLSLLRSEFIRNVSDDDLEKLCGMFFIDSFTFNQNACSSPRLVVWHGNEADTSLAQHRFWSCLDNISMSKDQLEPIHMMNRLVELCEFLAEEDGVERVIDRETAAVRLRLNSAETWKKTANLRFGTFSELNITEIAELDQILDQHVQTVTYSGYAPDQLRTLVFDMSRRGVDRVVPVGQALDFDLQWDGYDLIRMMTRTVVVR
jgi:Acyl-CoA reductase (LuxC)